MAYLDPTAPKAMDVQAASAGLAAHEEAVAAVSDRLKQFYSRRAAFRVYHGSTNSTRAAYKESGNIVDTSLLNHVLAVDAAKKTALVEPNVPMDKLVEATLAEGLVPLVVMEFPGITAGGGFSGSAGESSSGRHGLFDSTVNSIEIVTPNGDVLHASRNERSDLFWGAASAFGTVGIVTLLEIRLQDAAPYVKITHYPARSFTEASRRLQEQVQDEAIDFVDGIVFSPHSTVVCAGSLVDTLPPSTQTKRYLRRTDPWFYLDIQTRVAKSDSVVVDHVPLKDYLFRWDRGGFWVARYAFRYFLVPFNRITRYALDRFLHARVMYHALHMSRLSDSYVIQDVIVPFDKAEAFYESLHELLHLYPLWLCPVRVRRHGPDAAHGIHADFADPSTPEVMLNFGVWGPGPRSDHQELVRLNRLIEQRAHQLGGKKTLYAQTHYTEDEFWQTYNRPAYDAVRVRYNAGHLPSVYDKVKVDEDAKSVVRTHSRVPSSLRDKWPFQGLYGVYKAWRGGDYLLRKTSKNPAIT
ncbi:FAD binding domain protein [Poronia punctata]|nr:FAD binding domain protein [Poronia punctata]